MQTAIAIQVLPRFENYNQEELIKCVDKVIEFIITTGLDYEVSAFETTVEGDYEKLMEIIYHAPKIVINNGADSVMCYIKLNHASERILTIEEKVSKHVQK